MHRNIYKCAIKALFSFVLLILSSNAYAQSDGCAPPMVVEKGKCIPYTWAEDIVVQGTRTFNAPYFTQNIIPAYYPLDASYFSLLPSPITAGAARGIELNRRKKIHDCIADGMAQGMREIGQWVVREVTFDYNGKTARFDIVYGTIPGVPKGVIEVKTVLDYERALEDLLLRNQPDVANAIASGTAIPRGPNAERAGFVVNAPIGRIIPVWIQAFPIPASCNVPKR